VSEKRSRCSALNQLIKRNWFFKAGETNAEVNIQNEGEGVIEDPGLNEGFFPAMWLRISGQ